MNKRRTRYVLGSLAIGLAIATVQVNLQFEKLVDSVELSGTVWADMWQERDAAFEEYENESNRYSDSSIRELLEDVRRVEQKFAGSFTTIRDTTERISILPWNVSHHSLKTAFLSHLDARVDALGHSREEGLMSPELETTWRQFCTVATKSSPTLTFGRYGTRLARACAKGIDK